MRRILHDVEQNIYVLEIRSDDPDTIHNQLEHCIVSFFCIEWFMFFTYLFIYLFE